MPRKQTPFKFKIGDRVAERPRHHGSFATTNKGKATYKKYERQRYGTVLDLEIKVNARGRKRKFIKVCWDDGNYINTHEQMRLCSIEDLETITIDMRQTIGA